jgi:hypothetical protein
MWARLSLGLLLAILASFPADTASTLRERYGNPISESYRVRPGIVVWAGYGSSGHVCALLIKPEPAEHPLNRRENTIGDVQQATEILKELVPEQERGKYGTPTISHVVCGFNNDIDCGGVEEDWEKLVINRSGGKDATHYASIRWKRDECRNIYPELR